MLLVASAPRLTFPLVTPPLPDIVELIEKRANLVVVRSLTHHREAAQQTVKRDERELCQVELMELSEDCLSSARIHCRQFLLVHRIRAGLQEKPWFRPLGVNRVHESKVESSGSYPNPSTPSPISYLPDTAPEGGDAFPPGTTVPQNTSLG